MEEGDGEPVLEIAAHAVDGEAGGWGVLGFAACALVEIAGGDVVGAPKSTAAADKAVGPHQFAEPMAALVVGAVAFDESGV